MQQGMLYTSISAAPDSGYYIEQVVSEITHPLDGNLLLDAWREVFRRHDVFSTEFTWKRQRDARQRVRNGIEFPVDSRDLSQTPADARAEKLDALLAEDRRRGFTLDKPPLTRVTLVRWAPDYHSCIWTVHHTLVDGRSMAVVIGEVFALYDARVADREAPLPAGAPYRAYAEAVSEAPAADAEAFWKDYLKGYTEPAELPLAPPASPAAETGYDAVYLSEGAGPALARLAQESGCTVGTIVQAAWALVLSRYTQRNDLVFGVTKSVRHVPGISPDDVGLFINTLPMRVTVDNDMRVRDWLPRVREQWTALRAHEQTAISQARAWSSVRGSASLFNSVLIFEYGILDQLIRSRAGNWTNRRFRLLEKTPGALTLAVYAGERIEVVAEYDEALYRSADITRLVRHLGVVIEDMASSPDKTLDGLRMLSEDERRALLVERQPPPYVAPPGRTMDWFEAAARKAPDQVALYQAGRTLSYGELEAHTAALAAALRSLGAGPGVFVGLSAPRSFEAIAGMLGILRAGAAYVPIDPAYPDERLDYLAQDSGIRVVATVRELEPRWRGRVETLIFLDEPESWPAANEAAEALPAGPQDPAYMIYTSGTTGLPKGVMIHHAAFAAYIHGAYGLYRIRPDDCFIQFSSISFDAAVEEIFVPLCHGLKLVLRTDEMLATPSAFYEACAEAGVTVLDMPTGYWNILANDMANVQPPPCVRALLTGGEAMRAEELARWRAHVPSGVQLINTYGPTETTVVATAAFVDDEPGEAPIGRPVPGATALVLDRRMCLVPDGLPGELYVGGPQVALGYHNRPELTAERFLPNPFGEGRLYKTGDRVRYREDGQLLYLGRQDRQVKYRGFRVELDEVEAFLRTCDGVADAAATLHVGDGGIQRLIAYVVPPAGQPLDGLETACREEVGARMPDYMRPTAVMALSALPLNTSGKVDYRSLPDPEQAGNAVIDDDQRPQGPTEWRMARLWCKVLGIGQVGRNDNFFEIGGHSLQGVILLSHIERQFGRRLSPLRLYQAPTVALLARIVDAEEESAPARVALHPIQPEGSCVPLFFVGSTDLLPAIKDTLGPDQPVYSLNIFGLQEDDGGYAFHNVADVAAMFIDEIKSCRPEGPYALGGYCRDTMVAYEMARQLTAAGDVVRLVAMVDTFWDTKQTYSNFERHARNLRKLGWRYAAAKWKEKTKATQERLMRYLSRRAQRRAAADQKELAQAHRHALFIGAYYDAVDAYRPEPYGGAITLYMASEWGLRDTPRWKALCKGGVTMRVVDACHYDIWHRPQADQLGALMREDLKAVSGQAISVCATRG